MTVRTASPADAATLAHLQTESWRAAYAGMMPAAALDQLEQAPRAARWEQLLNDPASPATVLISADHEGRATGFCVFGASRDTDNSGGVFEVVQLGVAEAARRQGYGRALLGAVKEHARAAGVQDLSLWLVQGNAAAASFFAAQGFKPDNTQRLDLRLTDFPLTENRHRCAVPLVP